MIIDQYLVKARHEELLAEAERNRLLAMLNRKPSATKTTSARFFVWFGGLLSRWGGQLEDRFAVEVPDNQPRAVDRGLGV